MRTKRQKLQVILFLGVAVAALVLLAAGLSRLELLPGERVTIEWPEREPPAAPPEDVDQPARQPLLPESTLETIITAILMLLMPISIVYLILSKDARKRVFGHLMYLIWILAAFYLFRRFASLNRIDTDGFMPDPGLDAPLPPSIQFVADMPPWLSYILSFVVIVMFLGYSYYTWRRLNRLRESPVEELLVEEARETLKAIRTGKDLKDAVLRCYYQMSQVLQEKRGIRRGKGMTPREFEQQLEAEGFPGEYVRRLTRLFEQVRYGSKATGEQEEREATACLTAIIEASGEMA